jgi:hypothetical protein
VVVFKSVLLAELAGGLFVVDPLALLLLRRRMSKPKRHPLASAFDHVMTAHAACSWPPPAGEHFSELCGYRASVQLFNY